MTLVYKYFLKYLAIYSIAIMMLLDNCLILINPIEIKMVLAMDVFRVFPTSTSRDESVPVIKV